MDSDTATSTIREKSALLVGFVALAAAVLIARGSPPESYELSIYAGTPLAFWVGTGAALVLAVIVGLGGGGRRRRLGLVLGGASTFAIVALPVIRSYYFFGAGDSLTHLGWAKDILAGRLSIVDFLYPGTHTVSVFLAEATGIPITRAMLLTVTAFTAVFLVFVPLATWTITRDPDATALAAFAGLLLLPINHISVAQMAHPTSQAIMFAPLVIYLLARYLTDADRDSLLVGTPTGALLAVASLAILLVHPQQAANVIVVFAIVLGLQLLARVVGTREREHSLLAAQTVFLVGAFLLWAPRHERASGATAALIDMLLNGPDVGAEVGQRAVSLSAVGGSIELLFAKLFLVSLVFCVLAGLVTLVGVFDRLEDPDAGAFARYLGLALGPLLLLFAAYFVVSYATLHFRQLGFIMLVATILGAIALGRGLDALSTRASGGTARAVVGVGFLVMLALSVPIVFQSPHIHQSSRHVTEAQMSGYEASFEHGAAEGFIGVRGSGERWADAVLGVEESRDRSALTRTSLYASERHPATGENFTGSYLASHYSDRYLTFTDRARQQEVSVYEELRFDESGFESLETTPRLDRVRANGDVQTYLVNATN
ncbi:hypothetical protein BRC82_03300 [Halobacteriales archaeon QS_1_67_19]|nr:MAG: hypothetical protein BRC82_03300 [Halobacteriales archaeon QS_1_67_19]